MTALVGANGSGKSSFIKAIELFQNKNSDIKKEDYHNENTDTEMIVTLVFKDIFKHLRERLIDYIIDEKITIERVFKWDPEANKSTSLFHGTRLTHPEFNNIRQMFIHKTNAPLIRQSYKQLDTSYGLPTCTSKEQITRALNDWERKHPARCKKDKDDGSYFGISEKKQVNINEFVKFIFVPAVHDALDDSQESKNSALGSIMEEITRNIRENTKYKKFQNNVEQRYNKIMTGFENKDLKLLGREITKNIEKFISDASVEISWDMKNQNINLPKAIAKLSEDEYMSTVDRVGHGSQRAFIMSMLQYMTSNINGVNTQDAIKPYTLVLVIEEPEIYQHPNRQRHIARVLAESANINGVKKTQIIYTTHSPHFVSVDKISQIRLLRKVTNKSTRETKVISANMIKIKSDMLKHSRSRRKQNMSMKDMLLTISTQWMNEGFFADKVVLVEGISDHATITTAAKLMGKEFDREGISVIPFDGKSSLYVPFVVFDNLDIPTYVIWDCDLKDQSSKNQFLNQKLSSLFGQTNINTDKVTDRFACFKEDLDHTIKKEFGPEYAKLMKSKADLYSITSKPEKKPAIINLVLVALKRQGKTSKTLNAIVKKIHKLNRDCR